MSDLIDRQKALEEIYQLPKIDRDAYEFYRDVRESIKSMPSAEPRWIQVTERLPEKRGFYLITTEKTHDVDMCSWNGSRFEAYPNGCMVVLRPQAWMPLPEPYQPGVSE